MSDDRQYQYLGLTFTEIDVAPDYTLYEIADSKGLMGTAIRESFDPDGAPEWGVAIHGVPSTRTWFKTRLDAIKYLKEQTR